MKAEAVVLSITGSDGTGGAGIQADVRTISAMGGRAVTAISCITVQSPTHILETCDLPTSLVVSQVQTVMQGARPQAVKVGLVRDPQTIKALRDEIVGCRFLVCDPGILSAKGTRLMDESSMQAYYRYFVPECTLLMLKCDEAELLLSSPIRTDEDMLSAARQLCEHGAEWVLLRGGRLAEGRLTALLYGQAQQQFFTSYNIDGWQQHGVSGAMSSAIATRLAQGDPVPEAVSRAHDYLHSQVVYKAEEGYQSPRQADLYDQLMSLVTQHYTQAHDVAFYADKLCITPRYLSQVTHNAVGRTPKQVIDDYLLKETRVLLETTRLSIQEISDRLGFSSQTFFARFFKERMNKTPMEYRKE